eukprot:scaffold6870_cov121-Cylindrotheca_fusiformis.AAC.11
MNQEDTIRGRRSCDGPLYTFQVLLRQGRIITTVDQPGVHCHKKNTPGTSCLMDMMHIRDTTVRRRTERKTDTVKEY